MAEIEFSVISRRCLGQRHPDEDSLCRGVHALEQERNEAQAIINWQFTTEDARTKLHRLYPSIPSVTEYWWSDDFVLMGKRGNHKGCPYQVGTAP